jgi:hypothetical protein
MCELRSMSDQSNNVKTSPSMIGTVQLRERVAPSPCASFRGCLCTTVPGTDHRDPKAKARKMLGSAYFEALPADCTFTVKHESDLSDMT